jgi:hypothetical protein
MAFVSDYTFYKEDRLGSDFSDESQRTVQNTKFANYMLSNFLSDRLTGAHVDFATSQAGIMMSGTNSGFGIGAANIDVDSLLLLKTENERPLEKLQLMERPFVTVPYLGRGSCDPALESQLQQGEITWDQKSVSTVMEKSFMGYTLYPVDTNMTNRTNDAKYTVEEAALDGWVRGGTASRELTTDPNISQKYRPTGGFN